MHNRPRRPRRPATAGTATPFETQHRAIREEFAQQAPGWGRDDIDADLLWAADRIGPRAFDTVLDVAAGSGLLGRALSPRVRSVVALDLTPEMLAEGQRRAESEGFANIRFEEGTAEALPYADASFDLAVTRFSFHHFEDPAAVAAEMARVVRPGGRVAVIDMVADEDADVAARYNRLETLRDPTHTRALSGAELTRLVESAGVHVTEVAQRDVANAFLPWLDRTRTPEAARREILQGVEVELAGGPPTGMRPFHDPDSGLSFLHRWQVVVGLR